MEVFERKIPNRPLVPPSFAGAASMMSACAAVMEASWQGYARSGRLTAPGWVAAAVCALTALAAACALLPREGTGRGGRFARYAFWACACGALGAALAAVHVARLEASRIAVTSSPVSAFTYRTTGDADNGQYGAGCTAEVIGGDGARVAQVRLETEEGYASGTSLELVGRVSPLDGSEWSRSLLMAGSVGRVKAVRVVAEEEGPAGPLDMLRRAALDRIEPSSAESRALLAGIVCGRTTELDGTRSDEAFSKTGLTHLVAVSGSHLALIGSIAGAALKRAPMSPGARGAVLVSMMAAYAVFTGAEPSAARSCAMVAASSAAGACGRRSHAVSGLAIACMALVAVQPGTVFGLGFQLSAASVLFILLFSGYGASLLNRMGLPRGLSSALSMTLSAQAATLPLTLPLFGQLPLVSPVANLVAGPLMTGLLVTGLVLVPLAVAFPPASCALAIPDMLARCSIFAARLFAGVPFSSIPVEAPAWLAAAVYTAAALVFAWWPSPGPRLMRAAAVIAVGIPAAWIARCELFAAPSITVLDVGQADGILVRDGHSSLLVDAGVDGEVVRALGRAGAYSLDAVAITHWDRDHWGGLPDILASMEVSRVFVAEGAARNIPDELPDPMPQITEVSLGDTLDVGGFTLECVWPEGPVEGEENADSLVLKAVWDESGASALLTGDTESAEADEYASRAGDIVALKVGHHGSRASLDSGMLSVLQPEVCIASAGEGNPYGHPTGECIEAAEASGAAFLSTMDSGDVTLSPSDGGFSVSCSRGAGLE